MQSRVLFAILLQIVIEFVSATVTFTDLDMSAPLTVDRGTEFFDSTGNNFASVSYAGDINGDSIDDFMVADSAATFSGRSECGTVYVIFGEEGGFPAKFDIGSELSSSKGFRIMGATASAQLGDAMSYAGDVNNDGIDDIIVGAPRAEPSASYPNGGAVYVIFGKRGVRSDIDTSSLDSSDGFTIYGPASFAKIGSLISNAGDINRDEIDDIMLIATGTAYVIFGGGTSDVDLGAFTSSQGFKILNGGLSALSVVGDFNNDGIDDIVVASKSAGSAQSGMAWIIYGQSSGLTSDIDLSVSLTSGVQITGPSGGSLGSEGGSIVAAGDINGDGIDDVILGAPLMESSSITTPNSAGIAYIIYGKEGGMPAIDLNTNLDPSQGFYILGSGENSRLGTSVNGGFDANGDGIDDFVVGAPYDRPLSRIGAGAAFVIYGKSSSANIDTNVPLGDSQGFELQGGIEYGLGTVTRAGDVNNDGSNDILVGGGGNVYLLYSAPGPKSGKDKLSPVANVFSDIVTVCVFIQAALEPSSSNGIVIGSLSKIFEYTRYYDVSRSSNLEIFYQTHRRVPATIVIAPGLPNDTIEEFHGDNLAHPFITHGLYSSYVVNFFKSLMTLLILLGIVLVVAGIEMIINKRVSKSSNYVKMARLAVINYLITQYYNVFGDIFFFGALDYMTLAPEGAVDWISFFLAILFYLFGVLVLLLHLTVLRHYQARKPKKTTTEENIQGFQEFKQRHENVELLYKDFKDFSFLHQSYLLWITIRLSICGLTMTVLYAHPIAQAVINIVENIVILLYIWRKRFFQSRFSLIQQVAFEIDLLLVNICFLVSAGLDENGTNSDKSRYPLGQIIIIGIFASKFFGFITLIPAAIDHVRDFLKKQAEKKKIAKPTKDTPKEDKVVELEPVTPRELVLETDAGLIQAKPEKSKRGSETSNASESDLEGLDDGAQASPVMQSTVRQYSMLPLQSP